MPAAASARPIDRPAAHASRLLACTIVGTQGDDVLIGTPGRDVICARGGDDVVRGRGGDDVIYGGPGNDRLEGGAGNDRLYGWRGADRLSGGSGDDFLQGGPDPDVLAGGPGTDTVDYSTRHSSLRVTIGRGANDGLRGEGDDVRGDIEIVRAGSGNDVLVGTPRANGLYGGAGRDLLRGRGGRDTLAGGRGVDTIDCGRGGGARVLAGAKDHLHGHCGRPTPQPGHPGARIRLSNANVAENQPAGTLVGTLSARGYHRPRFALAGGQDNASFAISGNRLVTAAVFDFETRRDYTVGIRVTAGHRRPAAQAFTITVTDVNEPPVATDGAFTLDEDQPKAIDLGALASDSETSDANLTYTIVSGPAHGTLSGAGPAPTYTPAANYHGPDSFTYKVTDGGAPPLSSATQTVSLTVDPVNDAPAPANPSLSVDEDGTLPIDLTALASDVETSTADLTFAIVSGPAHGSLNGAGAYTPDPDYNGPDTITYKVTDRGDPDNCGAPGPGCTAPVSSTGTIAITVDPVDDAPVLTLPAGPVAAIPGADTALDGLSVSDIDADPDDVQLVLSVQNGTLSADTAVLGGVSPLQVAGNGTGQLTITASQLSIRTTLAAPGGLTYRGAAAGPDTLSATLDDLGHTGSGGPLTDAGTVAIAVDSPPVASDQNVTTDEDTPKAITLAATDADGDPLTFAIVSDPAHGTLTGAGANRTYTPDPNYNGPDSFTFKANDGRVDSAPATVSITVTAVDDAPVLAGTEATALAYTENDPATVVTATTTVSDVDSANFDTGTLTADFSAGGTSDDRLEIADAGQIATAGANVTFNGTTIGTFAGGTGTTPLVVTLNANADTAATQALVRAITYRNVSDNPATAGRTVRFVLTDGDGGTSAPATRAVTVTAVDDAPALAGIEAGPLAYTESVDAAPAQTAVTGALTVSDVDDTNLAGAVVQITGACKPGEDVLVFTAQNGITGTYTAGTCRLVLTGSASPADYQAALRSVRYENTSDTPDTSTRTVTFTVNDGTRDSNTQTRDVTVAAANDSPIAVGDTFNGTNSALAGVTLAVGTTPAEPNVAVSGSLLANDSDPDTPQASLTASAPATSAHGGTVTVGTDGTFSYTPAAGFTGSDTFTYTVDDHGTPDRTATATVTINVAGPRVWFVNPSAGAGGDGTSRAPLNSLAPLSSGGTSDSLDGNGDVIFVYQGNAASSGFVLENNQRLVGQPQGLTVTDSQSRTLNLVAAGGSNPQIRNSGGAGITLADGNTIQRVDVIDAAVSGTGVNTLAYGDNTVISGGLALSGGNGTISVGAHIVANGGHSVAISGRTGGTTTLSGAVDDLSTGILLTSNTGAAVAFTGTITAGTGVNPAFTATGGGTVTATGPGSRLGTSLGTALTVSNTGIGAAGLKFQTINANGAPNGIVLNNTGAAGGLTVTGNGGTCTDADTTGCSGGEIRNTTGADDASATPSGTGIVLSGTTAPSLTRMWIHDNSNYGIRGVGVNGFTLADSVIGGTNGTNAAGPFDEASVAFDNLTGSAAITNDAISGGVEDDVRIQNDIGSLNSLAVTGSTFATTGAATANDALALIGKSGVSVFNATVQNNSFTRAQGDLYQYTLQTGTGTMHFDSNTVTNTFPTALPAGGGDINVSAGSLGATPSLTYSINGNSIFTSGTGLQPPNGSVIVAAATPQGSATGTIQNNTIGATGVSQSGGFDSILADAVKAGFHKVTITGNTIRRYKEAGIRLLGVSPAAAPGFNLRATVKGNTITEPDSVAFAGIDAEVGADPSDVGTMCLDLGGTAAADKNSVSNGDPTNFNDINIIQQFATGIDLPGYGGAATDDAAVEAFVAARNNGDGTPTVSASHDAAGTGFTGAGTDCS